VLAHLPATTGPKDAPAIALRADMDALPFTENTGKPYASTTPGVMHACGHDGHTANLLGVARVLSRLTHRPHPVTLVFQPAEEGGAGGKRMCEDGALDGSRIGPKVARMYGLHGWPQYEVGKVGTRPGPMLAATDNFTMKIIGEQGHAAYPQLSRDPILAASHVITALQSICSRNVKPQDSIVVTIAKFNAGVAHNVIPREATLVGTMRTLRAETRQLGRRRFFQIAEGVAMAMGCEAKIDWEEGYPVTHNDETLAASFMTLAKATLGEDRVFHVAEPSLGGEDFSYYGKHVPACFFALGVRPKGADKFPSLHQPEYDFNDEALGTGIEMMCALVM
jgi:amidohydrolase